MDTLIIVAVIFVSVLFLNSRMSSINEPYEYLMQKTHNLTRINTNKNDVTRPTPINSYVNGASHQVNKLLPIAEYSPDCQFRTICNRSNNTKGVCVSGLCYPSMQ